MIKRDITFFNYADPPQQVTKTFYFNYTRLEGVEIELTYGDLEETMEVLKQTEDAQKAYNIFKEILVGAVGIKVNDNEFNKSDAAKAAFVNSPAMSTLIWEFIENPELSGPFIEGMLPAHDIAEGKRRLERERVMAALEAQKQTQKQDSQAPVQMQEPAPAVVTDEPAVQIARTDEEIQAADINDLTNEELQRLLAIRRGEV